MPYSKRLEDTVGLYKLCPVDMEKSLAFHDRMRVKFQEMLFGATKR